MLFKIILSKRRGMNFQSFPFRTKSTLIFLRRDIYAHFSPLNLESRNPITTTNGTFHDFLHRHSAVSNHRRETNVSCTINCFLRPGRGARSQIYRGIKLEIGNFLSLSLFVSREGRKKMGSSARKKEVICMLEADTEAI